jgi:hypothetical protein
MRFHTALLFLLAGSLACAQNDADPEVARVQAEVARVRALVEAGAAPRLQLQKAEDAMADAQDAAILRKTIYGKDLTEGQSDDMLAAANRRLERRKQEYAQAQKLVDAGAAAQNSLDGPREDVEMAAKEYGLAESRAALVHEIAQMANEEEELAVTLTTEPAEAPSVAERHDGDGVFNMVMFADVESQFQRKFGEALPVSAMGQTAVHNALGFDHRGRVDVALAPDSAEGEWLRLYLTMKRIPFFVFRQAVPGKATGAHIHIGPVSTHLAAGG